MRSSDKHKSTAFGKAAKSINFDKVVLMAIEQKARENGTTASKLVNKLCRQHLMSDLEYFRFMAKHHYIEFQRWQYLKQEVEEN